MVKKCKIYKNLHKYGPPLGVFKRITLSDCSTYERLVLHDIEEIKYDTLDQEILYSLLTNGLTSEAVFALSDLSTDVPMKNISKDSLYLAEKTVIEDPLTTFSLP